jgi:uncharacterized protein
MIRLDVSSLVRAQPGASLTVDLDTGPQSLEDLELKYLHGSIQVTRIKGGMFLQGKIKTEVSVECVRCLTPLDLPLTLALEDTFKLAGEADEPEAYTIQEDGSIDLAPLLNELSWTAIPMKPLCGTDCQGLCPQCGANLNVTSCECEVEDIDPRWSALKELL